MNGFTPPNMSPLFPLLPPFTFITGPNGSGKTTLANLLFDTVPGLQSFSFAAPIDDMIRAGFYNNDIVYDLKSEDQKKMPIPGFPLITLREMKNKIGDSLRSILGPLAMGEIALHKVIVDKDYFERFVFDDARRLADVRPIIEAYGKENCLIINLSRPEVTFDQPHHFAHDEALCLSCRCVPLVNRGNIPDLLQNLRTALTLGETTTV